MIARIPCYPVLFSKVRCNAYRELLNHNFVKTIYIRCERQRIIANLQAMTGFGIR